MPMEELKKGLTLRALIIGIVLSICVSLFLTVQAYTLAEGFSGTKYVAGVTVYGDAPELSKQPGPTQLFWVQGAWMFLIVILIFSILPKAVRLNTRELTVIFTMLIMTVPMVTSWYEVGFMGTLAAFQMVIHVQNLVSYDVMLECSGWYIASQPYNASLHQYPPGPIIRPAGVVLDIPWNQYMQPIVWNILQAFFLGLGCMFIACILRRQYIEVEELPFPNATVAQTLIENSTSESRPKIFTNKWLWIGFLVAQVLVLPGYIYLLGELMGLDTTAFQFAANIDLIMPGIPLALLWTAPWLLGFGTIMPMNFLISYFITWLVFIVGLVNIQWMTGTFTPPPEGATMGWYVNRAMTQIMPLKTVNSVGLEAVAYGVLISAALFPLWIHRKQVLATVKSIWQKPSEELEKNEALSYKWLYMGTIASFLAYTALFIPTPAAPTLWMAPIMLLFLVLWWVGGSRFIGTAGAGGLWTGFDRPQMGASPNQWLNRLWMAQMWGMPKPGAPPENAMYIFNITLCQGYWAGRSANSMPMPILLDCFKVASSTKTRTRDILIAGILGLAIPLVVANPFHLWIRYAGQWAGVGRTILWPNAGLFYSQDVFNDIPARGSAWGWRGYWYRGYPREDLWPDVEGVTTLIVAGIVLGIACFWLRTRYPKFIYTPLAIAFWGANMMAEQWFLLLAIALVIKYMVMRTYGVLEYQKKIIPLAVGLILGGIVYVTLDWAYVWTNLVYFA